METNKNQTMSGKVTYRCKHNMTINFNILSKPISYTIKYLILYKNFEKEENLRSEK